MKLIVTILGSGSSTGVPMIGCDCGVCRSSHPRNQRTRASILLTTEVGESVLIDTSPELRLQILRTGVQSLQHVIYTHNHSDHTAGFDDLRAFYFRDRKPLTCYMRREYQPEFRSRFAYAFDDSRYAGKKPEIIIHDLPDKGISIAGLPVVGEVLPHGGDTSTAIRVGRFVYATDFKSVPEDVVSRWRGQIDTMVASGIRYELHSSHSSVGETLDLFDRLGVRRGVVTHLSHSVEYEDASAKLVSGRELAYDGMRLEVDV